MRHPAAAAPAALLTSRRTGAADLLAPLPLARSLALGRVLLGGTCLVAPDAAGRLLYGRRLTVDGASGWRLLGVRDLALAVGALAAPGPAAAAGWVAAGAVSDAVDAVVLARDPGVRPRLRPVLALVAGGGGLVGLVLASRLRDEA